MSRGLGDVYKRQDLLDTVANSGTYTHPLGKKPAGDYLFRVCEPDDVPCAEGSITF